MMQFHGSVHWVPEASRARNCPFGDSAQVSVPLHRMYVVSVSHIGMTASPARSQLRFEPVVGVCGAD